MLDCRVPVRNYVLISEPSRWGHQGERVVVQSPMTNIPNTVSLVPVKRFHGEEQNSVCFIPRSDIEKDSSPIYEKSQVSKDTSLINAHGVAICNSTPSEDFQYRRGDKFWIYIGANTSGYEKSVPVINLRTRESGAVQIDKVCWYPKIRGPDWELWTLGGETRELKLSGAKKWSYMSWVVCQHLDGTKSRTASVEVPTKETRVKGRSLLTAPEARALFEKRLCLLESTASMEVSSSAGPPTFSLGSEILLLPTPPASPDVELAQRVREGRIRVAQGQSLTSTSGNVERWRRIISWATERNAKGSYMLRNSTIHPQVPRRPSNSWERTSIDTATWLDEVNDASDSASLQLSTRTTSPRYANAGDDQLYSKELVNLDGADLFGVTLLMDIARDEKELFMSLTASDPAAAIQEYWSKNKLEHNPLLDGLCDVHDPACPYTTKFTAPHFHPPPSICRLSTTPTAFAGFAAPTSALHLVHEHCISRLGPLPDTAGECLLACSPQRFPNHTCCKWDAIDYGNAPFVHPDNSPENIKILEARRKKIKIHDCSFKVLLKLSAGHNILDKELLDLGEAGRSFIANLDSGLFNDELGGVHLTGFDIGDGGSEGSVDLEMEMGFESCS